MRAPSPTCSGCAPSAPKLLCEQVIGRALPPAILRPERRGRVRRRVRRRSRHPVRLHGPSRGRAAAGAARDGPGQGALAGARCVRDAISARAGVPRRVARGAAVGHLRRQLDPGAHPRFGRTLHHAKRGDRRRRRGPEPGASRSDASLHLGLPPHQAAPGDQVARPRRGAEAAPLRPSSSGSHASG